MDPSVSSSLFLDAVERKPEANQPAGGNPTHEKRANHTNRANFTNFKTSSQHLTNHNPPTQPRNHTHTQNMHRNTHTHKHMRTRTHTHKHAHSQITKHKARKSPTNHSQIKNKPLLNHMNHEQLRHLKHRKKKKKGRTPPKITVRNSKAFAPSATVVL